MRLWERIGEDLGDFWGRFTRIQETLGDFGRGFVRICDRICEDL